MVFEAGRVKAAAKNYQSTFLLLPGRIIL